MHRDPLAFFLTWTCYGTWLPGDGRGWTRWHQGDQVAQPLLEDWCRDRMSDSSVILDEEQRAITTSVIRKHCQFRSWTLHAVNCRSNHCHVVVSATIHTGERIRDELKSWGTRHLKDHQRACGIPEQRLRTHWWTRGGSVRYLFDEDSLDAAILYTLEAQEKGGSKANGP